MNEAETTVDTEDEALDPRRDVRVDREQRALLRAGGAEFIAHPELSDAVILDEYVSLAHDFFDESDAKFANALLQNIGRDLRA